MATSVDGNKFDIVGNLPDELGVQVLAKLSPNGLGNCAQVCRRWKTLADSRDVWRQFVPDSVLEGRNVTNYKQFVIDNSIPEDEVTEKIMRFIKDLKFNELGIVCLKFLHDKNANIIIVNANVLEQYDSTKDGDESTWMSKQFDVLSQNTDEYLLTKKFDSRKFFNGFIKVSQDENSKMGENRRYEGGEKIPRVQLISSNPPYSFIRIFRTSANIPYDKSETQPFEYVFSNFIKQNNEDITKGIGVIYF